jgi:predicted CXXCH cytochrome family protein
MCVECHTTNFNAGFDPETAHYESTWDEIDVGCEACHGPGSRHVEWAETRDGSGSGLIVDLSGSDSLKTIESCARCHSRRHQVSPNHEAGRPFLDDFMPETLRAGLYHPDGQIEEEVYVYGSFLQSLMYARGVGCSDCHDPHSLRLRAEGNELCAQCHNEKGNPRFPSLRSKTYDTQSHHFHKPASAGSQCVNCHMPTRTYMQIDSRHDHRFGVPRPDLSEKLGTPNACTGCHQDQSDVWATQTTARWYPDSDRTKTPHFAESFQAGRDFNSEAVPSLISIAGSAEHPAIVRATAVELLSELGPSGTIAVIDATSDDDAFVRATAVAALSMLPPEQRIEAATPRLQDPLRAVRMEAARVLSAVSPDRLTDATRQLLELELDEYTTALNAHTDTPPALFNLALLDSNQGRAERAIQSYLAALAIDPDFLPARANLAILYSQLGQAAESERLLREGIARDPEQGEFHYSLGLLLAEGERFELAAGHIGRAAELLTDRPRVHYNHGLLLQRIDNREQAEIALAKAVNLAPDDPDIVYGLIAFYFQQGDWEKARPLTEHLLEITRGDPQAVALMNQIEQETTNPSGR